MSNSELTDTVNISNPPLRTDQDVVISVCNIGKMYRLYERPQDRLKEQLLWRIGKHYGREFWALRDVSFEVRRGETVGIIGRNGSGKSTLLQIIAGTLTPTSGEVSVKGRVAALLELGSGFNPEFTGRENILLNGAVLGISGEKMQQHLEAIVAFADIGNFIEQPVKTYSSGMLLRLAFAVQIHVEADLLIIDEALAVGDVFFQAKCSRALQKYRENGGTLLFVSHDLHTVERLCTCGLLLHAGQTVYWGEVGHAVEEYYKIERNRKSASALKPVSEQTASTTEDWRVNQLSPIPIQRASAVSDGSAYIESLHLVDDNGQATQQFSVGQEIKVYFVGKFHQDLEEVDFGAGLCDRSALFLGGAHSWYQAQPSHTISAKAGERWLFHLKIRLSVAPGTYLLRIGLAQNISPTVWIDFYTVLDACSIVVNGQPSFWGLAQIENWIAPPQRL